MEAVYFVQVTSRRWVEKRFPQGRGVGVPGFLGEENEKKTGKKGLGNRE
jgi:hypothetical protein